MRRPHPDRQNSERRGGGEGGSDKDNSPDSWKEVVKKYSESASPNGGLQPGVTEEQYAGEVGEALFSARPDKVEGPVKYATSGFVVFEVEKENPEKVQPLGEAEAQIKAQLQQQAQEDVFGSSSPTSRASGGRGPSAPTAS